MTAMDPKAILDTLPHRYPFLLIDRVVELEVGRHIVAIKNVTANEPFFQGHFPENPVMPGVLILEALAQAAAILGARTLDARLGSESIMYLAGVDEARFKRPVVPGDTLLLRATLERTLRGVTRVSTTAHVGDELVAEARLLSAIRSL
jgi:3-hydroxyacyl-[acyl-carrier-protein] dehydratase